MNYLQCDAEGCDHRENTPDYGPHLIGKPCPVCGASLLTQEDFDGAEPYRLLIEELIKAGIATTTDRPRKDTEVAMGIHFHAGKTSVTIGGEDE